MDGFGERFCIMHKPSTFSPSTFNLRMGMISARFCVYNKQGTPNDVANVEKYVKDY